ncbi:MAG: glycosyltransferase family 39 protein [Chloroflexota bacterium]|nr:glycosyltransferase family 39 protein [Chloroflexota bacterium]
MRHSRSFYSAAVSLLVLVAFASRSVSLDNQSLWRDEVDALCYAFEFPHLVAQALAPEAAGDLNTPCACPPPPLVQAGLFDESVLRRLARILGGMIRQNGPLYFFLLRGWVAVAGASEYSMRFFSLVCGVICVPLVYVLGCRLFDRQTGLLAALLVTVSPYLTWYGQEVKMYTLVPALALLAIYGLRRAVEGRGWRWWAVQVVATSLAFYSHILAALLIPVQALLCLVWWPQVRRRWAGALVSLACLTLPYLPLVVWQAPQVLQVRETGFYQYSLGEMVEILLNGWSLGITSRGWPWGAALMGALAVWGLVSSLFHSPHLSPNRKGVRAGRNRLVLVCWLATPLLAVWFVSLRQPLFTDRYLIWTAPAFYMLVALGLAALIGFGNWGRWVAVFLMSVVLVFDGVNLWQQAVEPLKSDFRAAAAYVADHHSSGELIIFQIPHSRYTFDYYFPDEEYPWADGLYTNHRAPGGSYLTSEQDVASHMQGITAGYGTVWLVATETMMWDERGLVQTWLEANREQVDEAHSMRVDVYQYTK